MSPITSFWIVRNPGPDSTLADILWRQHIATLDNYILGIRHAWQHEMHTVHTSEVEARADAEARLRAVANGLSLVRRSDGRVVGVRVPGRDREGSG